MKKIPIRQISSVYQGVQPSERFTIRKVQDIVGETDLIQHLHRHNFFFILALQTGDGTHDIDFNTYKVRSQSIYFLRPGQVHQLELKAGCTGFLVEYNAEFYNPDTKSAIQRFRRASHKTYCKLDANRFDKIQATLTAMYLEYRDKEEGYNEAIRTNLNIFFIEFVRQSPNPSSPQRAINQYTQERLDEFLALMDLHITTHKLASQYAGFMNLSLYQMNEITKTTLGKVTSDLINERIILEAKRYLLATPDQIKDIADHLGYKDVSYFIRFFKKHAGYTPEAFRHNFG
ncbi:MAG: helix-turn-helix domain-containing protein [Pedobacter sp.]|nr:MAG: helix-turn-helix domain-containing protein [Pedobacter sp.]